MAGLNFDDLPGIFADEIYPKYPYEFTTKSFPELLDIISTRNLVLKKDAHQYDGNLRVDSIYFFGLKNAFTALGLLLIRSALRNDENKLSINLSHPYSDFKSFTIYNDPSPRNHVDFRIEKLAYWNDWESGYLHPLVRYNLLEEERPFLNLGYQDGRMFSDEKSFQNRDYLTGFTHPMGNLALGETLLDFGHPESKNKEFYLEWVLPGFRSAHAGSIEARFLLPNSDPWELSHSEGLADLL